MGKSPNTCISVFMWLSCSSLCKDINAHVISKNTAAIIYMELIKCHNTNYGVIMYANTSARGRKSWVIQPAAYFWLWICVDPDKLPIIIEVECS